MSIRLDLGAEARAPDPTEIAEHADAPAAGSQARDAVATPDAKTAAAEFNAFLRTVTPHAWVTSSIVAVNVGVFALMTARGVGAFSPKAIDVLAWGADYGPRTLGGEPWRMLVNVFLHFGAIHLAMNMVALWDVGHLVERVLGRARFAAVYLAAGLGGSVASLAVHPQLISAGASGAVFGVYGALGAFLVRERGAIPAPVLSRLGRVAFGFIAYNTAFGLLQPNVDVAAHVGGLVAGAVAGAWLSRPLAVARPPSPARPGIASALALGAAAVAYVSLPRPVDVLAVLDRFASDEAKLLTTFNELVARAQREQLTDEQVAAELESSFVPGWREARARLPEARRWPRGQQHMAGILLQYARSRENAVVTLATALRSHDEKVLKQAQAFQDEAESLVSELKAQAKAP